MEFRDFFLGDMYCSLTYAMCVSSDPRRAASQVFLLTVSRMSNCSSASTPMLGRTQRIATVTTRGSWASSPPCHQYGKRLLGTDCTISHVYLLNLRLRRFLQCIRRYWDTKNIFPHLVNCGKYAASISAAVCLSVFRIERTTATLAAFVVVSVINGIYTGTW